MIQLWHEKFLRLARVIIGDHGSTPSKLILISQTSSRKEIIKSTVNYDINWPQVWEFPHHFIDRLMKVIQYNSKTISFMEPMIDEQIIGWLQRVDRDFVSEPGKFSPFDIGKRIQFLTVDIITKLCLGEALGCVANDKDMHDFLATVQRGNAVCQHFSVLLELNSMIYYLTKIPILSSLIVPKTTDQSGVGRIMGVGKLNVSHG